MAGDKQGAVIAERNTRGCNPDIYSDVPNPPQHPDRKLEMTGSRTSLSETSAATSAHAAKPELRLGASLRAAGLSGVAVDQNEL